MGRIHPLSREQIQGGKDRAVRFARDVVGDPDRAAEIEDEDLEAYAERRKLTTANPMQQNQAARRAGFDAGAPAASCRSISAHGQQKGVAHSVCDAPGRSTVRRYSFTCPPLIT
jgi:hypothetical protein